jgi:hypothetical protein
LPLVVRLDQDAGRQPQQRVGVGEDPDDVGAALDLAVEPLEGLVDQIFCQCACGKSANAVRSPWRRAAAGRRRGTACEHVGDDVDVLRASSPVGWAKIVRMVAATISAWPLLTLAARCA